MIQLNKIFRIIPYCISHYYIKWNRVKFRIYKVKFGKNFRVYDRIYLTMHTGASMIIGDNFVFSSGNGINPLCRNIRGKIFIDRNAHISIGDNTGLSSACLWAKESIQIGNRVNIGGDCILMDTDAHNLDWEVRAGIKRDPISGEFISDILSAKSAPIVIEDDVLIGTRSIILKGVTIGARSIIAAGSIVTKSIPADCIAGGNPCTIIRFFK